MAGTDRGNTPQSTAQIVSALAGVVLFLFLWLATAVNGVLAFILGLVFGVVVFLVMTRMQSGGEGGEPMPSATKPPSTTVPPATAGPAAEPLSGVTSEAEKKPAPAADEAAEPAPQAPETPAAAPAGKPAAEAPAAATEPPKPAEPAAPAPSAEAAQGPDDLKRINGIGPVIEKKLNAMGVQNFRQIAEWSEADIARIDEELNARGRIARDDWVGQARALADGGT